MPLNHVPPPRASIGSALLGALLLAACNGGPTGPSTDPPSITTSELPDGLVAEPYAAGVSASGGEGAFTWTVVSGSLPPGLELSVEDLEEGDDLVITGTPETEGSFTFDLEVEDEAARTDTARLSISISPPPQPLAIETTGVPPALAGHTYRVVLTAIGGDGDIEWSVVDGELPQGLSLTSAGRFDGVPAEPDTTTFTVRVTSDDETDERTFTLVVNQENTDQYDIAHFPVVEVPAELENNVREAIRRWEAALTGDLPSFTIPIGTAGFGPGECLGFGTMVNGTTLDDILIIVNIDSIDGPGQVLAQAGPCHIRDDSDLPTVGVLVLDEDDLLLFTSQETVTDIIQHEIGHVLGFGALWNIFGVLEGASTADPRYTGDQAVAAYQEVEPDSTSIPVANQGGQGTRDAHWREETFGDELLTGFSAPDGVDMYLSRMSIASMADLGYEVDLEAADDAPLLPLDHAHDRPPLGYDIVGVGPIATFDQDTTGTANP